MSKNLPEDFECPKCGNRNTLEKVMEGEVYYQCSACGEEYEEVSAIDCCYHDAHNRCMKYNKECYEPCDDFEIDNGDDEPTRQTVYKVESTKS